MDKRGGGSIKIFVENFLSHSAEKFCRWTLLCCVSESFRQRKSLWIRGEGGVSRFSVENLLSHSAEKVRRGTFLCFGKSLVSKNVRDKRGGGYHDFPSKLFCLTVPKNFVGEPFGVSKNFWCRSTLWFRGICHEFPSKIFCLTVPKHFVEEPFGAVFQKFSGSEKVYG